MKKRKFGPSTLVFILCSFSHRTFRCADGGSPQTKWGSSFLFRPLCTAADTPTACTESPKPRCRFALSPAVPYRISNVRAFPDTYGFYSPKSDRGGIPNRIPPLSTPLTPGPSIRRLLSVYARVRFSCKLGSIKNAREFSQNRCCEKISQCNGPPYPYLGPICSGLFVEKAAYT